MNEHRSEAKLAVRDALIKRRNAIRDHRWIRRINRGFWILEHIYPFNRKLIEVSECCDFTPHPEHNWSGRPGYLDVQVRIPMLSLNGLPATVMPWIFTVENINTFVLSKSSDDAHTEVWWNYGRYKNDKDLLTCDLSPIPFWTKIQPQLPELLKNPIVEYDHVWTNQEDFCQDDVIKYARFWLGKFYPNLAKRKIIWTAP